MSNDIVREKIAREGRVRGITEAKIDGKTCYIYQHGTGGPIIYWATFLHRQDEITHLIDEVEALVPDEDFTVVAFLAEDWNRDFSPWPAPAAFGDADFEGGGQDMLYWLEKCCIPTVEKRTTASSVPSRFLIGYSLAGLFALWAAYETDLFSGIASCSGSLWFKDWDAYAAKHSIQSACNIYLSLGGKEEKTKNQMMSQVGNCTRRQEEILQREPLVRASVLEWNSGGHFADSGKRLAKGIFWLLQEEKKKA